jgi:hypothetical protein
MFSIFAPNKNRTMISQSAAGLVNVD